MQKQITDKIFAEYRNYPTQFLLITEAGIDYDPYAILTRYLDISKKYGSEIRNGLSIKIIR
jgi:hypothetical protein